MTDKEILDYLDSRCQFARTAYDVQIGDFVFTVHAGKTAREAMIAGIERHVAARVEFKLEHGEERKLKTINSTP